MAIARRGSLSRKGFAGGGTCPSVMNADVTKRWRTQLQQSVTEWTVVLRDATVQRMRALRELPWSSK